MLSVYPLPHIPQYLQLFLKGIFLSADLLPTLYFKRTKVQNGLSLYQYTERVLSHWFSLKAQIGIFFYDWYFFHGNCAMCLTVFFGVLGSRWLHLPKMCDGNCFCSRTTRELLCNWELFLYIWGGPLPCPCCCCHDCHRQVVVNTCFLTAEFLLNTEWNPALKTGEECR
jgi:hypothetical protein